VGGGAAAKHIAPVQAPSPLCVAVLLRRSAGPAWVNFINESAMMHVFAGQVFDHYRLVLEKK
jgi:hypothetical protein